MKYDIAHDAALQQKAEDAVRAAAATKFEALVVHAALNSTGKELSKLCTKQFAEISKNLKAMEEVHASVDEHALKHAS